MGGSAGIPGVGDDLVGGGVCGARVSLALNLQVWPRGEDSACFLTLSFQRCGSHIKSKSLLVGWSFTSRRRMLQASLSCNELSPSFKRVNGVTAVR